MYIAFQVRSLFLFIRVFFLIQVSITTTLLFADAGNLDFPPKPSPKKAMRLPSYEMFSLKNGLRIYFMEDRKLPMISYFLYMDYLPSLQKDKSGVGEITTRLMKQGAGNRDKAQIDSALDFMGTDFSIQENLIYSASLIKYASQSLEIFSEIIKSPRLDKSEFLKVKEEMLSEIKSAKQDPNSQVDNIAKTLLYPKSHPYSEIPTERSLQKVTMQDCEAYHKKYFRPNIAHLAIVGDLKLEDAKLLAETHFGNWESGAISKIRMPKLRMQRQTKIYLIDRPDSVQSVLRITHNIKLKPGDKDIYSAVVMNTILGGGTFRLYQNLRENHGYTYGVYSTLHPDKWAGNFSVDFSTKSSLTDKSIEEVFYELNRIRKEKVKPEELQLVKNYLSGQFSLSLENPSTVALFGIKTSLYSLPADYFEKYLEGIANVTDEDALRAANKYILPEKTNIIIVGKKRDIKRGLKSLRKFKVQEISNR